MILNHAAQAVKSESPRLDPFDLNRRILGSSLSLAEKAVLIRILDHARYGTSQCTASTRTLAKETKMSEQHARRILRDLEGRRLIRTERVTGSSHSRHTIFVGPCIDQIGREFPLRVHEVELHAVEHGKVAHQIRKVEHLAGRVGEGDPYSSKEKSDQKSEDSSPPSKEEIDPWTRLWFGGPPTGTTDTGITT